MIPRYIYGSWNPVLIFFCNIGDPVSVFKRIFCSIVFGVHTSLSNLFFQKKRFVIKIDPIKRFYYIVGQTNNNSSIKFHDGPL